MTGIWAKTILRSRNASAPDRVLSTLLVRLPTVLMAEFNTHRAFSRNAASTRAIPTERLIEQVRSDPFIPMHWGKNQKGMQAGAEIAAGVEHNHFSGSYAQEPAEAWLYARDEAVAVARGFASAGYHKQIAGRLLAPFMWTIVCVSATEWDSFLELRDHSDAEPHMQVLAKAMRVELERDDNIQTLKPGEWHLPFMSVERSIDIYGAHKGDAHLRAMIAYSVACCASTSYKTVDGFDMTIERAVALHDRLVGSRPIHASPAEHVAQADRPGKMWVGNFERSDQHRNFRGFRQYRAMIEGAA